MLKILSNLLWQFGNQAVTILNGILIGAMVARHLGPENYGVLSNALSLLNISLSLLSLGLDGIIVREYLQKPNTRTEVFWTAFWARAILSLLLVTSTLLALQIQIFKTESATERVVLGLIFLNCLSSPLALAKLVFDAEVSTKFVVIVSNITILLSAIAKIILVVFASNLIPFAIVNTLEFAIIGISTFWIASAKGFIPRFAGPSWETLRRLLWESWPLLLSGLSVAIYSNIDIAMLRAMKGPEEVGIYSVAVRMSSIWYVIPVILSASLFPSLAELHHKDRKQYVARFGDFLSLNVAIAYLSVLLSVLVLPSLIRILYGEKYEQSIPVFYLHIISVVFVFWGVARSQHLTLERLHKFLMFATFLGMVANISMNWLLIPMYGAYGAAISTIASQMIATFLSSAFLPRDKSTFKMQLESLYLNGLSAQFYRAIRSARI